MTNNDKISWVRTMLQNDPQATDDVITTYLDLAKETVLHAMFPLGNGTEFDVPEKYNGVHCQLAARYFSRRGGLGEIEHNENGIARVYASATDRDLLSMITPFAKVV